MVPCSDGALDGPLTGAGPQNGDGEGDGVTPETWYAGGSGVLLRSGRHLLLLDTPPTQDLVDRCWAVLAGPGDVPGQLLALVDHELPGVSLVLLDLTPGSLHRVVRGDAQVLDIGTTRRAVLGTAVTPGAWLPLDAGVVPAGAVELRVPVAATPATGIIDGIPPELLLAMAESPTAEPPADPTGEPPARTVRRQPDAPDLHEGATRAVHSPLPDSSPDHDGATVHHRVGARPPAEDLDHDGATVHQPAGARRAARVATPEPVDTHNTVLAVLCPQGHVTSAMTGVCRVCGAAVPEQEPHRIPRPVLGGLLLPTGDRIALDRGVLLGRRPTPLGDEPEVPHIVYLPPDNSYLSRMHVQIVLEGWLVVARDLGSRGGSTWKVPGRAPERMRAHEPYLLEPGHSLDLADSYEIVYEVTS